MVSSYIMPSQKISAGIQSPTGIAVGVQLSSTDLHYSHSVYSFQGVGLNVGFSRNIKSIGTGILVQVEYRTGGIQSYQGDVFPLQTNPLSLLVRPEVSYRIIEGNCPIDINFGYDVSLLDLDPTDEFRYRYSGFVIGLSVRFEDFSERIIALERKLSLGLK